MMFFLPELICNASTGDPARGAERPDAAELAGGVVIAAIPITV